jgi:uncharacterized protein YigA (DUF484 family)
MSAADNPTGGEPTRLTDEEVISYLRLDPDFFQRHASLLSELNLPHESGAAVSLVERQVAILRERNMNMRRRMNELIEAAKENESLFEKIRSLTLELLYVDSWHWPIFKQISSAAICLTTTSSWIICAATQVNFHTNVT